MEASERFFQNRACPYFPCHRGVAEEEFNCLFCFCPLYMLGSSCGGKWHRTPNGYKDCSACTFPHRPENYDRICARYSDIMKAIAKSGWEDAACETAPEERKL